MLKLAETFRIYTIAQVHDLFPKDIQPSKSKLEELIRDSGCYHNIAGKVALFDDDVAAFFNWLRAHPTVADTRSGAGGLLRGAPPAPNAVGYMVVIGAQGVEFDDMLWVSWVPQDVGSIDGLFRSV